ncbi:hypothetical protein Prudu_019426 [Prunus dulcis]|uniref:Uncharacterized protein n=1 Tax=Prunus dulcis TaxID=3755 RepID=A0A4Y1RUM0_PRUDU|nr:hypothetical protein Prudu_019426 [Prunus dulcis]
MHAPGVRLTSRRDPREVQLARTSSLRRTKETARAISLASAPPPKWEILPDFRQNSEDNLIKERVERCRTRTGVGSVFKAKIGSGPVRSSLREHDLGDSLKQWRSMDIIKKVMELYCDNQAVREIANNPVQHDRTKHVEVDMHYIKEKLVDKLIDIPFEESEEQLSDILTHAVSAKG